MILLASLPNGLFAVASEPVVVLLERERRELLSVARGSVELLPVSEVLYGLGVTSTVDPKGALVLSYAGREVVLYEKRSLASVGGDLRLLSAPPIVEDGRWLVPVDSLPRLLSPLLNLRCEWRPSSRVLLIGEVAIPRVGVKTFVSGDSVRVVIESSDKAHFRVSQEEKRVLVSVPGDLIDVSFQEERLTGGIVDKVQFLGGRDNLFAVGLGRRFQQLSTTEDPGPPSRLVIDFQAAPLAAGAPPSVAPAKPTPPPPPEVGVLKTVVIDPGHGGPEVGAKGPGGSLEKDLTLVIARKLRAALTNSLGIQAFLTRDRDQELALDDRAAFANNYKADIFISIHANASRSQGARGSEVFFLAYQSTDEESRRVAAQEGDFVPNAQAPSGSDLALILWDMAQAEHLEESSALASRLQEELAEVTGSQGRGIKQAPFRVLVGAAMPAVLVEVAFISNAEEEKLLASDAYQNKVVGALVKGVARYQQQLRQRAGLPLGPPPGPGRP
ncbi:MAG TPA: N-acetylmuramoyl-L-alanine amidase [Vicinamibacteria bacterium]|nr:N-acetylmuramoyl-L-alanine amidase [Vicinamibacteria bacterium]